MAQVVWFAQHTYDSFGSMPTRLCLTVDQQQGVCDSKSVLVESLVSLDLHINDGVDETRENSLELEVELENAIPQGWNGRPAEDILLRQVKVPDVRARLVAGADGCRIVDQRLRCSQDSLSPGEKVTATVQLSRLDDSELIYDLGVPFALDAVTASRSLEDVYSTARWITFKADPTDSDRDGMTDVFEKAYGLNPNAAADARKDQDSDGLTNLDEYNQRTNPTLADSDGDGAQDNDDFCPLDDSGVVEGTNGLCQEDIRRSPVLHIIQILSEASGSE